MTMENTPPDALKSLSCAYADRERLRELLLDGGASKAASAVDDSYFSRLRNRVRQAKSK